MKQLTVLFEDILNLAGPKRGGAPRTRRLLDSDCTKKAKKMCEEAVEVALEAIAGDRDGVIAESADLLYNLLVLWAEAGVSLSDVDEEMKRRRKNLGIAEKLPKVPRAKVSSVAFPPIKKTRPPVKKKAALGKVKRSKTLVVKKTTRKRPAKNTG